MLTMNLSKSGLWALGVIELPTLITDELKAELNAKSGKCDKKKTMEKMLQKLYNLEVSPNPRQTQKRLLPQVLRTITIKKKTIQLITC